MKNTLKIKTITLPKITITILQNIFLLGDIKLALVIKLIQ